MSQADELLDSLTEEQVMTYTANPTSEPHILINADRTVTVPEELKHIAVQGEHNIETITFDCPRYWDGHDLSQMSMRIVYQRPDGHREPYPIENLSVDESDNNTIHFDWTISGNVTVFTGNIFFMVCAKIANADGITEREWHSRLNQDLVIDEGLECTGDKIVEQNPDILEHILVRLDTIESTGGVSDEQVANAVSSYMTEHPVQGVTEEQAQQIAANARSIETLSNNKLDKTGWVSDKYLGTDSNGNVIIKDAPENTETDPTVPEWAKQSVKPTYSANELGADPAGTAENKLSDHDSDESAHMDIREAISQLSGQNPTETNIFAGKIASFYGDSLTEVNNHYTKGYHSWVKDLLGLASYNNYGASAYTVANVYSEKVNKFTDTADIIFVMCGVNDQTLSVPLGEFGDSTTGTTYGSLDRLCNLLKEKYPTAIIVFITPHYQTKYKHSEGITSYEVSKAVRDVCGKYAIPVYDNFVLSGICASNLSIFTTDNCHWNDIAHEMVGKNLSRFMLNTFGYIYRNSDSDDTHTHSYTGTVTTAATCTTAGVKTFTCECGNSYTESIPATGHKWDSGVVTTEPTEEKEGVRTYTCTVCGETYTESIPALEHEHSYVSTVVSPTCTNQGYTEHVCSCGDSYKDTYVDATGHNYVDGVCSVCGEADPDAVDEEIENGTKAWYSLQTELTPTSKDDAIDTGITILDNDRDFTIALAYVRSDTEAAVTFDTGVYFDSYSGVGLAFVNPHEGYIFAGTFKQAFESHNKVGTVQKMVITHNAGSKSITVYHSVDGTVKADGVSVDAANDSITTNDTLVIGGDGARFWHHGTISAFDVFKRAWTSEECAEYIA